MTSGLNACLGITPKNSCPIVDSAVTEFVQGFVPSSSDRTASQIIVGSEHTDELDDWPHLTRTLRTEPYAYYRLDGFGLKSTEDAPTCSTCESCTVSECLLSTFSCLPVDPYECFWLEDQLCLRFALEDRQELEDVIDALRTAGYDIDLRHLSHDDAHFDSAPDAVVNLEVLTQRQREALKLAAEGDYFDTDGADIAELASELGVSTSTFSKHTRIAMKKLIEQTLEL